MWTAESDNILQSHHQQIHHTRPEFRTPLTNLAVSVGQPIELACELSGNPKPNIFWKLNGKPLLISDRIKVSEMSREWKKIQPFKLNVIKILFHICIWMMRLTLQLSLAHRFCGAQNYSLSSIFFWHRVYFYNKFGVCELWLGVERKKRRNK